jgi:hypothetical protein
VRNLEPSRRVGLQAKRGEKIAALQARSNTPGAYVNGWSQAKELSPEAEALFPGQMSVLLKSGALGQGKNTLLRYLCASVVDLI